LERLGWLVLRTSRSRAATQEHWPQNNTQMGESALDTAAQCPAPWDRDVSSRPAAGDDPCSEQMIREQTRPRIGSGRRRRPVSTVSLAYGQGKAEAEAAQLPEGTAVGRGQTKYLSGQRRNAVSCHRKARQSRDSQSNRRRRRRWSRRGGERHGCEAPEQDWAADSK
jgi:hypothetical protein